MIERWRQQVRELKRALSILSCASNDPRVPWYVRLLAISLVAYAFSPLDLIPDVVPVLGYLDDFILLPLGIVLVLRLIPKPVLDECRAQVEVAVYQKQSARWIAAAAIVVTWLLLALLAIRLLR